MLEQLLELDKKVFVFLNNLHAPWADPIVYFSTQTWAWLPLYIFLLYLIIKEFKKKSWIILLGVVLTILLADQFTTSFMKPYFERLRPSHEPTLQGLVHLVNRFNGKTYTGGQYSFASSHAANTFGVATFLFLLFKTKKKWIGWLFLWAAIISYTRIYLGVHYPGDILVGGLVGVLAGIAGFKFHQQLTQYVSKRKTPPEIN